MAVIRDDVRAEAGHEARLHAELMASPSTNQLCAMLNNVVKTRERLFGDIPVGKTRVIYVDLFSHEDGIVGDYDSPEEAFRVADEANAGRTGSMDDVHYVYNDQGKYIRGPEAVNDIGVSP